MSTSESPLFEVRQTEHAGRGVVATQGIKAGTPLLSCSDLKVSFIYRDYLREVCAWCFAYNRGRNLAVRDGSARQAWCSEKCKSEWSEYRGYNALPAHQAVETLLKKQSKRREDGGGMQDPSKPTSEDVELAWQAAEKLGAVILETRNAKKPTKTQSRILAKLKPPSPEILTYLLAAVLSRSTTDDPAWEELLALYPTSTPYPSQTLLKSHILAYHHLLAILPTELLSFTTPTTLFSVVTRDAHNSFGVHSLDDEGSEMFGHGIWPSASCWNHSCAPNVDKRRSGRTWEFSARRDVGVGEELCITYLGGEEEKLRVQERRGRLRDAWAFDCVCGKCVAESMT